MAYSDYEWPQQAKDAVQAVNDAIPKEWHLSEQTLAGYPSGSDVRPLASSCKLLTDRELDITNPANDATHLLHRLHTQDVTAKETVTAFAKRAAIAHQAVTCLAGFYYQDALARAAELDQHLQTSGKPVGPLHGLPISVKSNSRVKGQVSSAGFSSIEVSTSTAHLIQILLDAGAIVFCRTTLPQAIMALECLSFWGETLNPLNTSLSPGGSSGGCSALMAFGGSPMSFGSDIGGSLRQPASCVGLWTLKATVGRIPKDNSYRFNAGSDGISPAVGPQTRSLRDLLFLLKTTTESKPWLKEHAVVPLPWKFEDSVAWKGTGGRIRVGYMESDGVVRPQPPIVRGIRTLVEQLKKSDNFEVVPFEPYDHRRGGEIANALYYPDGGRRLRQVARTAGDPILPLMEWALTLPCVKDRSMHELWDLHTDRDMYRAEYLAYWQKQQVDIVICPAQPQTAPQRGTSKYWGYTSVYNILEWPAAVFPTGLKVDEDLDKMKGPEPTNETERDLHSIYESMRYANTPICLQAFAGHWEDERLLLALAAIEQDILPLAGQKQ